MVETVLDVAGDPSGGAGRWRAEAVRWLEIEQPAGVQLVGLESRVTLAWLVRRESMGRGCRRIAANNVSFVTGGGPKIVLLRNALHFLRDSEATAIPHLARQIRWQRPVIRSAARRADLVVVPCSDMADRVASSLPGMAGRIRVRHHPLTVAVARRPSSGRRFVLYAASPAAHKDLRSNVTRIVEAIEAAGLDLAVRVTAPAEALGKAGRHPLVDAAGIQDRRGMDRLWAEAFAAYAPSLVESFGYPVAEARAIGVPIMAPDTDQNREIGGGALVGYAPASSRSLAEAVMKASTARPAPDPRPFEPKRYFTWLTGLGSH